MVSIDSWTIWEGYIFGGPIVAQVISMFLVEGARWLYKYDFGQSNEMGTYWLILVVYLIT